MDDGRPIMRKSLKAYHEIRSRKRHEFFVNSYLPMAMGFGTEKYECHCNYRVASLLDRTLDEKHVRWVLNRMLEFSAWMESIKLIHGGINPDSVLIMPEPHGIQVISFYHLTKLGNKMRTIPGKYAK